MTSLTLSLGLCAGIKCKENEYCEVIEDKAQCVCKDIRECPRTLAPVCGDNDESYINKCHLDVENCLMNRTTEKAKEGQCGKFCSWQFSGDFNFEQLVF